MNSYRRLNWAAVILLVVLRLTVGWHFFKEGVVKVEDGFSSAGFLSAATGPYADFFREMVPDSLGLHRINADRMTLSLEKFTQDAQTEYGFSEAQIQSAQSRLEEAKNQLTEIYDRWKSTIAEYQRGYERHLAMQRDKTRDGVESLRNQRRDVDAKWSASIRPVLADVSQVVASLENALEEIATPDQRKRAGKVLLDLPAKGLLPTRIVDRIIPIFDMSVGILLILGLLTPLAGTLAGLFLVSVVLTQFPGSPDAAPTYYQAIEAAACFLLAASDSGRYGGLDFIPWSWWASRRRRRKRVTF